MAAGRAAALLAVAVGIGVVLLNAADDPPPGRVAAAGSTTTTSTSVTTSPAVVTTTTVALRAPGDIKVISANGTDVKGVARKVTDLLKAAGYNVLSPTDGKKTTASAVYFVGDFGREAQAVAGSLALPASSVQPVPTPSPIGDARGATVIVVVGPDLAQRVATTTATTAPVGATTATTRAGGSTATTRAGSTATSTTSRAPTATASSTTPTTHKP